RDFKPSNVIVDPKGRLRLVDLGAALDPDSTRLTGAGELLGSPGYISPEQVRSAPVDARSDLYSIGITLYLLAAGRRPFEATTLAELLKMHSEDAPPDPRFFKADLAPQVAEVLL